MTHRRVATNHPLVRQAPGVMPVRTLMGLLAACFFDAAAAAPAPATSSCTPVVASLVSIEGNVKIAASETAPLRDARPDEPVCAGYIIEVGERSRAALQLPDETVLRLDQRSRVVLSGAAAEEAAPLSLTRGALHVITRTRRRFQITTPFINANVNGTEFTVRVDDNAATVSVVEGEVRAARGNESLALQSGEAAIGRPNETLRKDILVRTRGAVQWALYYPAILDCSAGSRLAVRQDESAERIVALCRASRFAEAVEQLDRIARPDDPHVLTFKAGMLLAVGRYDEATAAIDAALRSDPGDGDAYALRAIMALVLADAFPADAARELAARAIEQSGGSPAALIAASYAHQAAFRVEDALEAVLKIPVDARTAAAWARIAELELSVGEIARARAAARRALELDDSVSKAHSMLAFASLLGMDLAAAREAFDSAIARDQSDPLPRLGLGLTRIRAGDLEGGRAALEVAAILDPGSSLMRSYLGKAYFEEKRDALAAQQYDLAKRLDENDPTPWLYSAVLMHVWNRPVDALADIDESSRRNDNRAVYRGSLLLDDDSVMRTSNRAALYLDLGLERLSIAESAKAVVDNITNDAAHRQLAASYLNVPRHDIARVSEALQAQVRQPLTIVPVDPFLAIDNLVIPRDVGFGRLGLNEYSQLYSRNQARVEATGVVGSRSTVGDELLLSVIADRFGAAYTQLHYESDGFQDRNSVRTNAYDMFLQMELTPKASLQLDGRRTTFSMDEVFAPFTNFPYLGRTTETSDLARVGGHYTLNAASDVIWSVFYQDRTRRFETPELDTIVTSQDATTVSAEAQYTAQVGRAQVTGGFVTANQTSRFAPPLPVSDKTHASTAYVYSTLDFRSLAVKLIAGASYDWFRFVQTFFPNPSRPPVRTIVEKHRWNPKVGLVWSPLPQTTVRAAYTTSLKRPFVASQTLEPAQVAGFNQFFAGFDQLYGENDGTVSRRAALAIDQKFGRQWYAGAEWSQRKLTLPDFRVGDQDWHEDTGYGYVYRTFGGGASRWQGALTMDYEYEKLRRSPLLTGVERIVNVTTQRLQLGIRAFERSGITLAATTSYVKQAGTFATGLIEFGQMDHGDRGWITDVSMDYRLPGRYGTIGVGARNLFDNRLILFETDPINPRFPTRRLVYGKFQLQL